MACNAYFLKNRTTITPIHLHILCGYFLAMMAELSTCDRDHVALKI